MKIFLALFFLLAPCAIADAGAAAPVEGRIGLAESELAAAVAAKNAGRLAEAERKLEPLLTADGNNPEVWFQYGLVLRYQGRVQPALEAQTRALRLAPHNVDVILEIARLQHTLGDRAAARARALEVLRLAPDYKDAAELLALIDRPPAAAPPQWRFSASHEMSRIPDRDERWLTSSLSAGRAFGRHAAQLYLERSERYATEDFFAALSATMALAPLVNLTVGVGGAPDAEFLPAAQFALSADWQPFNRGAALLFDASYNRYDQQSVRVYKPGVRLPFTPRWEAQVQAILVDTAQNALDRDKGWSARVGWHGRAETLRVFAGYADAPETDEAFTIPTTAIFAGLFWQFSPAVGAGLSAATEKRENSFTRHVVSGTLSLRY